MWWLFLLAVFIGLFLIPIRCIASYQDKCISVILKLGPFSVRLYPRKGKSKKEKTSPQSEKEIQAYKRKPNQSKGSWTDFFPVVQSLLDFLGRLRRQIIVKKLSLEIILAGGDPCDLSVNYGRTWVGIGNLLPQMERLFRIKDREIDVKCDYLGDQTSVCGFLDISITFIRLLSLVVYYGLRILKQYFAISNKRKGGAGYEPKSSSNA